MDANDSFAKYISRREDVDVRGYYDVIAHGQTDGILITHNGPKTACYRPCQHISHETAEVETSVLSRPAVSCSAVGSSYLWATPSGEYFVAGMNKFALPNRKNIGKFKLFMPF